MPISGIPSDGYHTRDFRGSQSPCPSTLPAGKKTICGVCGTSHHSFYDHKLRLARDLSCGDTRIYLEIEVRCVWCRSCGKVRQEQLSWLADNPFYTKRFAFFVGRRCRASTIKDVARELHLDWKTVKELDKQYMQEQWRRIGTPGPRIIGIDEVSIRKGHTYRIVVSDLVRQRPIWFGGRDRSEGSMDQFYQWLGAKKCRRIELAVMDMWKPSSPNMRPRRRFFSTSSTSCAIWGMLWTRCARANMPD